MSNKLIKEIKIKELFASGKETYRVPIYQRNFAWEEPQIFQLVEDIAHAQEEGNEKNYYLGILVVHEKTEYGRIVYETIDGQQRLTALFILLCVLKKEFGQKIDQEFKRDTLDFESRDISDRTLDVIFDAIVKSNII